MKLSWTVALSLLSLSVVSCENGLTLRDKTEKFTIFTDGSVADDIVEADDGSVSWVATASGGAGGGVAFYVNPNKDEINIANYKSIDLEFDYSIIEGKWNETAMVPGFAFRILPWDSSGLFGGYEELEYFESDAPSGSLTHSIEIPSDFADRIVATSDFDSVLGFALKFNDYERGNERGDQLKVTLKSVKFNAKENAPEDKPFDDGLTDAQRGTVVNMYYPTRDYTVDEADLTDADRYEKHAWVYLPAGYDAADKDTKYPLFILLHGGGQNEHSWGLSDKGRGGKIKGYMDRGMADGSVEKFVLVAANGIASKNWGPNGSGTDMVGSDAFEGELRNDLLPYIRANFNIKEGRDNVALAGLSRGGGQTLNIGVQYCLDLFSQFAGFSVPKEIFDDYVSGINARFPGLTIHNFYLICGTQDPYCVDLFPVFSKQMQEWEKVENFKNYVYIDGTHDFPVWYKGFYDFIHMIFKNQETATIETPVTPVRTVVKKVTKCRVKKN